MPKVIRETRTGANRNHEAPSPFDRVRPVTESADDGLLCCWYGMNGCLSGSTFISYKIFRKGRADKEAVQNVKGGTLENLYRRFHRLPRRGKGYYQRKQTIGSDFYVSSITDEGRLTHNLVTDVIDSGARRVFEVVTASGKVIRATANHEFMTEGGYVALANLRVGDDVLVSAGRRFKAAERVQKINRPEVYVNYHPSEKIKVVNDCSYHRLARARLVYEAFINGMEPPEYREFLNTRTVEEIRSLWTVPPGAEIHHVDENPVNDVIENLVMAGSSGEHQKEHHSDCVTRPGMAVYVIPDRIESITALGTERVYDIAVADPFRNFIAAGFAVHNSGKTSLACTFPKPLLLVGFEDGTDSVSDVPGVDFLLVKATEELPPLLEQVAGGAKSWWSESGGESWSRLESRSGEPYATVVADTATSLQDLVLKEILNLDDVPVMLEWGVATMDQYRDRSSKARELLRRFLDLPKAINVVVLAQEKDHSKGADDDGGGRADSEMLKPWWGPSLGKSTAQWLCEKFDHVCQTYVREQVVQVKAKGIGGKSKLKEKRTGKVEYCLRTQNGHSMYASKVRKPRGVDLPSVLVDPTYFSFLAAIRGEKI